MKHSMNLQQRFFDYIKNGTKRIELRLFDEKGQKIKVGDVIYTPEKQAEYGVVGIRIKLLDR